MVRGCWARTHTRTLKKKIFAPTPLGRRKILGLCLFRLGRRRRRRELRLDSTAAAALSKSSEDFLRVKVLDAEMTVDAYEHDTGFEY